MRPDTASGRIERQDLALRHAGRERATPPARDDASYFLGGAPAAAGGGIRASMSSVIATLSLTTTPPPSRFAFHLTPKSCRLTLVVADAATRDSPRIPLMTFDGPVTSSVTSLVTPCIVRSPTS